MPDAADAFRVPSGATLETVLRMAARAGLDAVDARLLICHALGVGRVQLITQSDRTLGLDEAQRIVTLLQRRVAGEPVAYLVGEREFFGLPLYTTSDVLIPRPETELLVELALERLPQGAAALDMGTGSGAIAIALRHTRPDIRMTALDASRSALEVARRNAQRHALDVHFVQSDWFTALADHRFDCIVSNPPYIVAGDPHLTQGDLRFEPLDALTDHGDGLGACRSIIGGAQGHLEPGAWLLLEHGYDQAEAVRALLQAHSFVEVQSWQDLAGIERVSGARRRVS